MVHVLDDHLHYFPPKSMQTQSKYPKRMQKIIFFQEFDYILTFDFILNITDEKKMQISNKIAKKKDNLNKNFGLREGKLRPNAEFLQVKNEADTPSRNKKNHGANRKRKKHRKMQKTPKHTKKTQTSPCQTPTLHPISPNPVFHVPHLPRLLVHRAGVGVVGAVALVAAQPARRGLGGGDAAGAGAGAPLAPAVDAAQDGGEPRRPMHSTHAGNFTQAKLTVILQGS